MARKSDRGEEARIDALLSQVAEDAPTVVPGPCLDDDALAAYQAEGLEPLEAQRMEFHLARCGACRQRLVDRVIGATTGPAPDPSQVWGRAICVAVLGPEGVSPGALRAMKPLLEAEGAWVSPMTATPPWVAMDIGSGALEGDPVSSLKLARWLQLLLRAIPSGSEIGAIAAVGRGILGASGPFGRVVSTTLHRASDIVAAELRVDPEVAAYVRGLGLDFVPVRDRDVVRVKSGARPERVEPRSSWGSRLRAWISGGAEVFTGMDLAVSGRRAERSAALQARPAASVANPFFSGDFIRLRYQAPANGWLYLLLQSDDVLSLPFGDDPICSPGEPPEGSTELELDDSPAFERPLLLATLEPVDRLSDTIARVNTASAASADERLEVLVEALRTGHQNAHFALLDAGSIHHLGASSLEMDGRVAAAEEVLEHDDYAGAEAQLRDVLAGGVPEPVEAVALSLLGRAVRRQGRSDEAIEVLTTAESLALKCGDRRTAGIAAREAARALMMEAERCDEAARCLDRALEYHRLVGAELDEAYDHAARGSMFWHWGQMQNAAEAYRLTLEPARRHNDLPLLAGGLQGLGQVWHELGNFAAARRCFEEALTSWIRCGRRWGEMRTRGDLGLLAVEYGEHRIAVDHFRAQLQLAEEIGTPLLQAMSRLNLGRALKGVGRLEEARSILLRALEGLPEQPKRFRAEAYINLGELEFAAGRLEEAGRWLEQPALRAPELPLDGRWRAALARGRWRDAMQDPRAEAEYLAGVQAVESVRESLPRLLRTDFLELSASLFEEWIGHLARRRADPVTLINAVERSRARAFLDGLAASERGRPEEELGQDVLAGEPPAQPLTLDRIQEKLTPDVAFLVTYCLPDQVLLFRVTRAAVDQQVVKVARSQLEQLCGDVRRACQRPGPVGRQGAGDEPALRALSELLLEPIRAWLEPGETMALGVVPHGPLQLVPFHALPVLPATGGGTIRPLVALRPVFYAPTLQAVAHWLGRREAPGHGVLALANPDGDLPHAEAEARGVLSCLGAGWLGAGREASAEALVNRGAEARYIHLAVHASRGTSGERAVLHLALDRGVPEVSSKQFWAVPDLADRRLPPGAVDAAWISRLKLNADLVVLSACNSGTGSVTAAGEGPDLLSWAFLVAGARAVISTGWRVDDRVTARLMNSFYSRLARGVSRAEALAMAQVELMAGGSSPQGSIERGGKVVPGSGKYDLAHPYYWAGFFLTGDWR